MVAAAVATAVVALLSLRSDLDSKREPARSAPAWAARRPSELAPAELVAPRWSCAVHPNGVVSHAPNADDELPPAFDARYHAPPGEACGPCPSSNVTGVPEFMRCGTCQFENRTCEGYYPGREISRRVAASLCEGRYRPKGTTPSAGRGRRALDAASSGEASGGLRDLVDALPRLSGRDSFDTSCVADFTPCELFARIRGRTLFFMGDSQTWHFYYSAECFLRDFSRERPGRPCRKTPVLGPALHGLVLTQRPAMYPLCLELVDDTKLCAVRVDFLREFALRALPLLAILEGPERWARDIIVMNSGLHYGSRSSYDGDFRFMKEWKQRVLQGNSEWLPNMHWNDGWNASDILEWRRALHAERDAADLATGRRRRRNVLGAEEPARNATSAAIPARNATGAVAPARDETAASGVDVDPKSLEGTSARVHASVAEAIDDSAAADVESGSREGPTVIWMDVPPQHFNSSDGGYRGRVGGACTVPRAWLNETEGVLQGNWRNQIALKHIDAFVDHRLRTWNASMPWYDSHKVRECTHWCSPGVYHAWLTLLNGVLAEPGVGNEVGLVRTDKPLAFASGGGAFGQRWASPVEAPLPDGASDSPDASRGGRRSLSSKTERHVGDISDAEWSVSDWFDRRGAAPPGGRQRLAPGGLARRLVRWLHRSGAAPGSPARGRGPHADNVGDAIVGVQPRSAADPSGGALTRRALAATENTAREIASSSLRGLVGWGDDRFGLEAARLALSATNSSSFASDRVARVRGMFVPLATHDPSSVSFESLVVSLGRQGMRLDRVVEIAKELRAPLPPLIRVAQTSALVTKRYSVTTKGWESLVEAEPWRHADRPDWLAGDNLPVGREVDVLERDSGLHGSASDARSEGSAVGSEHGLHALRLLRPGKTDPPTSPYYVDVGELYGPEAVAVLGRFQKSAPVLGPFDAAEADRRRRSIPGALVVEDEL